MASPLLLDEVLSRADIWRGGAMAQGNINTVSSGFTELDAELPGGGWPQGCLTELLARPGFSGEFGLLQPAVIAHLATEGWLALISPPLPAYAPALQQSGIDLKRFIVVAPKSVRDTAWACEQIIASGAFAASIAWLTDATPQVLRRLQMAGERHAGLAFVVRPVDCLKQSSPAPLRVSLHYEQNGLQLRIIKRRGAPLDKPLHLPCVPAGVSHEMLRRLPAARFSQRKSFNATVLV